MDRVAYLTELTKALSGLSDSNRGSALAYYGEYLAEAEAATEGQFDASAILGSPRTLAAQIKADLVMGDLEPTIAPPPLPTSGDVAGAGFAPSEATGEVPAPADAPPQDAPRKSGMAVVWTVVLAILAIPVGIPLAIALAATIFAVLVALGAVFIAFAAVVVSLFAVAILSLIVGFVLLFSEFAVGLFYLGAALLAFGFCVLFGMAFWRLGKLCAHGVARLFNTIRKRLTRRERSAS